MSLEIIGPHPFEVDEQQQQKACIGTLFLQNNCLYTRAPGVHAWQRVDFIELLNQRRKAAGLPPLTLEEEEQIAAASVDLVFEPGKILIRPDPSNMDQAFEADELLQELVSKRKIFFLSVSDPRVREAIQRRGEYWRINSIPKDRDAKFKLILDSKVAIHGQPIYFYNRLTGTRWLTVQEFEKLGLMDDENLALHLHEVADHATRHNRLGRPEIAFFATDIGHFGGRDFAGIPFKDLPSAQLRAVYRELRERFRSVVHEGLRGEVDGNSAWCERMVSSVFFDGNETQTEQVLTGLSPEFFLQIEWLPGGRFEEGEFLFDSLFDEALRSPDDPDLQRLCDIRAKSIIFNFIREHGDLEYINVGIVRESLSRNRPLKRGRRGVYISEFKPKSEPQACRRFTRTQKWGVWEHLDQGKELLQAMRDSDEYTEYWLDRRLGCRQLGMNLARHVVMRHLMEKYQGSHSGYHGVLIRTTCFERDFLPGLATDKVPPEKYGIPGFALRLAQALGTAAASSMIVGRSLEEGTCPVFDDGDELICEDDQGLPRAILVADHSGAFGEYQKPLKIFAAHYAGPVNNRERVVPNAIAFAEAYLAAFREQFVHIQSDYRKRRRAFDNLFKHCKYDPAGSFAFRWECVLSRLERTNIDALLATIRQHIRVLNVETRIAPRASLPEPAARF